MNVSSRPAPAGSECGVIGCRGDNCVVDVRPGRLGSAGNSCAVMLEGTKMQSYWYYYTIYIYNMYNHVYRNTFQI